MTPASIIPVFGSQRPYADLNFAAGSFGLNGTSVSSLALLAGFTFTRASLAMGYDATGKLTYGPHNLCLQSQTFGTTWAPTAVTVTSNTTTAPDGTLTADTITPSAGTTVKHLQMGVTGWLGTTSTGVFSVYAKAGSGRYIQLMNVGAASYYANFDLVAGSVGNAGANVTAAISDAGGGWYRCSIYLNGAVSYNQNNRIYAATSNTSGYAGTTDSEGTFYLWGAQIEAVTYQTTPSTYYPTTTAAYYGPRLVYDPVTLASQGILVEEARTNLILQSQTFDNASWQKSAATVTANSTTSPDGTANADTLLADAGTGTIPRVADTATAVVTSTVYTASIYAKAGTYSFVQIYLNNQGGEWANFTLSGAGTASANGSSTASITALPDGWYRLAMTYTAGSTDRRPFFMLAASGSATRAQTWNPAGTESIYLWQAQLEAGTGASSPIPTTTASVTRAADLPLLAISGATYPMTVVATFTRAFDNGAADFVYQVDGGSSANRVTGVVNSSDTVASSATTGGIGQGISTSAATVAVGALTKMATRTDASGVQLALNGVLAAPSAAITLPSAPTTVRFGLNDTVSNPGNLMLARLQIYNRALSNAELQAITL